MILLAPFISIMPRRDDEDGDTILDDRLSDYDGDEDRGPEITSGEAAAIREAEKNRRKIQTLLLVMTFLPSCWAAAVRPRAS